MLSQAVASTASVVDAGGAEVIDLAGSVPQDMDISELDFESLSASDMTRILAATSSSALDAESHWVAATDGYEVVISILDRDSNGEISLLRWAAQRDGDVEAFEFEPDFSSSTVTITSEETGQSWVAEMDEVRQGCDSTHSSCTITGVVGAGTALACTVGGAALVGSIEEPTNTIPAAIGAALCAVGIPVTALTALTCAFVSPYCPTPQIYVTCSMDSCYGIAEWVSVTRSGDNTDVQLSWTFSEVSPFENNESDEVRHVQNVYEGQVAEAPFGLSQAFRYVALETIYHSDIRCDEYAFLLVAGPWMSAAGTGTNKPSPRDLDYRYCSNYGMSGEIG